MFPDDLVHSIRLTAAWEAPGQTEKTAWVRRFGRPAGVGPQHRVCLMVVRPRLAAAVRLNGVVLPALAATSGSWSHDVTALLRHRNLLAIEPDSAGGSGGDFSPESHGRIGRQPLPVTFGEVRLDIVATPAREASDGAPATMSPA